MSGIIGGAGSKSGVIGETELYYEEGEWTPIPSTGSFTTVSGRRGYTRMGGICFCNAYLGNMADGAFATLSGLPFTTRPSGPSYDHVVVGNLMMNYVNLDDAARQLCFYIYNMNIYIYQTLDNGTWTQISGSHLSNNDDLLISFAYECQS